jgi:hypothetical protein
MPSAAILSTKLYRDRCINDKNLTNFTGCAEVVTSFWGMFLM